MHSDIWPYSLSTRLIIIQLATINRTLEEIKVKSFEEVVAAFLMVYVDMVQDDDVAGSVAIRWARLWIGAKECDADGSRAADRADKAVSAVLMVEENNVVACVMLMGDE